MEEENIDNIFVLLCVILEHFTITEAHDIWVNVMYEFMV